MAGRNGPVGKGFLFRHASAADAAKLFSLAHSAIESIFRRNPVFRHSQVSRLKPDLHAAGELRRYRMGRRRGEVSSCPTSQGIFSREMFSARLSAHERVSRTEERRMPEFVQESRSW